MVAPAVTLKFNSEVIAAISNKSFAQIIASVDLKLCHYVPMRFSMTMDLLNQYPSDEICEKRCIRQLPF